MVSFWMCLTCNNFCFGRKMHLHCLGIFFFCAVFVLDKPFAKFFFQLRLVNAVLHFRKCLVEMKDLFKFGEKL